jgi:hypothetical protein
MRGGGVVGPMPRGREAGRLAENCPATPCNQLTALVYMPLQQGPSQV